MPELLGPELLGKVAIVTGAARGIGKASATALAAAGAKVLLADINEDGVKEAAAEIEARGGTAFGIYTDITDEDGMRAMVDAAVSRWGRLDTLMNNATTGTLDDVNVVTNSRATWDRTINGTLLGTVWGCKYAIPEMIKGGGGSIINVSSNAALGGDFIRVAYGACKAGVVAVTKYTATAFGKKGIRCNVLSPGVLVTPAVILNYPKEMRDVVEDYVMAPRLGEPEDAGPLVVYLASDGARFINGQTISVDGGMNTVLGPSVALLKAGTYGDLVER
jgi:NAD(P)-dependent dehydrogenase (short-subunit alcohol dehydrogenase family)